jgi:hypothetical protein
MTCLTEPCDRVEGCVFDRGCVQKRFHVERHQPETTKDLSLKATAKKLNGTKPSRRKAVTP